MDLVGSVQDSDVIIVDDMIDTAGTLCKVSEHHFLTTCHSYVYRFYIHKGTAAPPICRLQANISTFMVRALKGLLQLSEWKLGSARVRCASLACSRMR